MGLAVTELRAWVEKGMFTIVWFITDRRQTQSVCAVSDGEAIEDYPTFVWNKLCIQRDDISTLFEQLALVVVNIESLHRSKLVHQSEENVPRCPRRAPGRNLLDEAQQVPDFLCLACVDLGRWNNGSANGTRSRRRDARRPNDELFHWLDWLPSLRQISSD